MGLRDRMDASTPMSCDFVFLGPSSLVPVSPSSLLRTSSSNPHSSEMGSFGVFALSRISCLSSHSVTARVHTSARRHSST